MKTSPSRYINSELLTQQKKFNNVDSRSLSVAELLSHRPLGLAGVHQPLEIFHFSADCRHDVSEEHHVEAGLSHSAASHDETADFGGERKRAEMWTPYAPSRKPDAPNRRAASRLEPGRESTLRQSCREEKSRARSSGRADDLPSSNSARRPPPSHCLPLLLPLHLKRPAIADCQRRRRIPRLAL